MKIQKLDTIYFTRGNSLRIEFAVKDNNADLQDYDDFRITIRKGITDQSKPIVEANLHNGITLDLENNKIVLTVSHADTAKWSKFKGFYFGELQSIYDGAPYAEAEFKFQLRQNINSI